MAELKWTDEPAPRAVGSDTREWRIWNEDDGTKSLTVSDIPATEEFLQTYALLAASLTEDAAKQLAQRIENVLDPPECPTKHTQFLWNEGSGSATSQDGVTRFESESHEVRQPWHTRFCPDCGAPLTKES